MALPTDSSEIFLREVDENLRRDQLSDFAKTYGKWLIVAVVLFLAAVGGWLYWRDRQQQEAAAESEELHRIFGQVAGGQTAQAGAQLEPLAKSSHDAVRGSALLTQAAVALERNKRPEAIAKFRAAANDQGLPEAYRNAATVRLTALEFDTLQPAQVIARLEPLAKPGQPWFGSAGEMTAMAYIRQGQNKRAGELFARIAADQQVPDAMRSRAVQIAGTLGVDASASLPGIDQ